MRVVLDTSVLVAASRSSRGASHELIRSMPLGRFEVCLSVALYAEWMDALSRPENRPPQLTSAEAAGFLRYLAGFCHLQPIYFLWRPCLVDPDDDMVLELAVAAGCRLLVTHNVQDFSGSDAFGVQVMTPREFLRLVRGAT
ncbi:MAG: PIN domain-containing protein [Planctomycetia bacterium]|nr:PIN domain-containing protein [Planctomycetia bacterium]